MIDVSIFSRTTCCIRANSVKCRDSGVDKNHLVHVCNRCAVSQDIHTSEMNTCNGKCRIKIIKC